MHVVLWRYVVRPGAEAAFEALHGADGPWTTLFADYAGWLGTELLREDDAGRYLTIDRWTSEDAYVAFLADASERYAALDEHGDALTLAEERVGAYRPC